MTFLEWRKREGLSLKEAAARISRRGGGSITGAGLQLLEAGRRDPYMRTADLIARGTDGAVTRMDWPETKPENPTEERGDE